jgi:hypothetical protein
MIEARGEIVELEDLRSAVGAWVKERRPYSRMPEWLYDRVRALHASYSVKELSKLLGIRIPTLKRALANDGEPQVPLPTRGTEALDLVKVGTHSRPSPLGLSKEGYEFTLEAPSGVKLHLVGLNLMEALAAFKEVIT